MDTLSIKDMMDMQTELQKKYEGIWQAVAPENAHKSLLWALGEVGEIIDIFKKKGHEAVLSSDTLRTHFMEETVDVMMYLWDMLACMGISSDEFSEIYAKKHDFNMKRTYGKDKFTEF